MPTILVTNDDGVHSPGLLALKQGLESLGKVVVLAPAENRSAVSHAISLHSPLRISPVTLADGSEAYSCSGTPADCVRMAVGGVLNVLPDIVVSGINSGHNMGVDIAYSGTVACAREGAINGLPSVAVSTVFTHVMPDGIDQVWQMSTEIVAHVVRQMISRGLPSQTFLNVNVPGVLPADLNGIRVTTVGNRSYTQKPIQRQDPDGNIYYWSNGIGPVDAPDGQTDVGAVGQGYASITPLMLDGTANSMLGQLREWFV